VLELAGGTGSSAGGDEARFPAQVHDIKAAIRFLRVHDHAGAFRRGSCLNHTIVTEFISAVLMLLVPSLEIVLDDMDSRYRSVEFKAIPKMGSRKETRYQSH
jgi:hypothetical protein